MTAAPVLRRPNQVSTTRVTCLPTPLTCSLRLLDGRFAACPAELPNSPFQPYPPR